MSKLKGYNTNIDTYIPVHYDNEQNAAAAMAEAQRKFCTRLSKAKDLSHINGNTVFFTKKTSASVAEIRNFLRSQPGCIDAN